MKPYRDFILCELIEEARGGLVIAKDVEDSQQRGRVLATGPGRYEYGQFVANDVKPGQVVRWQKFAESGAVFNEAGKHLALIRESQVMAVEES